VNCPRILTKNVDYPRKTVTRSYLLVRLVSAARPSSGRRRPFSTGPISKRLDSNSNPTPGTTIETRRCSDRWPGGEPGQTAPAASPTSSCRPTWAQCYKTFYGRISRMFVISWSVCPWQAFPEYSNACGQGQDPTQKQRTQNKLHSGKIQQEHYIRPGRLARDQSFRKIVLQD
jgi:hypothetical protein